MEKHYNIQVIGRVQGVFYRKFVQQNARFLGLKGFVKNCIDGSVYIEVEGDTAKLYQFNQIIRKGTDIARIDDMIITEDKIKNYNDFRIKY